MQNEITTAWLVMLLIGFGAGVIGFLLRRAVAEHDEELREHRDLIDKNRTGIAELRVDVARAQAGTDALGEQLRVLRHDVRDVKSGVEGIANHILQLLGKGKH